MGFYMRSPVYTPNDPVKSVKQLHSWVYQLNENLKFMFSNLDSDNFTDEFSKRFSIEEMDKIRLDLETLEKEIGGMPKKSEWAYLTVTGLTPGEDENAPSFLNTGVCVFLSGNGALTEELPAGGRRTIAALTDGTWPEKTQVRAIAAGGALLELEAMPSGALALINSSQSPIPEGTLIPLSMVFGL